ncbi:histidine kinase [Algoriphagus sp. A40]|uniref:histidine kinase n=1 Tax=Algoriphagus sp. A40 TaxID=1945863 RepID=UPI000986889A|nr:histidine kinase [Algoriphagus sp. A40]OOG70717.1 histidine kinase [Algoriphagus sp. A40]
MSEQVENFFLSQIFKRKKGRLKVYIGMIAGVGKSFRMLQEAHELLQAGVEVKIGLIETHERPETEALVLGLPLIPRKQIFYKGKNLEEMDLETILTIRPEVVIVDELAHTNIPGSKNQKRWQDVVELMDAGINVVTAFNVQHLESINDIVEKLTKVKINECIPDKILSFADEVVNIDLPSDDLIKRLKEGKIYAGDKIVRALENFFKPETILQLRDLALRQVALQVEKKIDLNAFTTSTMPREIFLACLSSNYEGGKKIIRKTSRLAGRYHAKWAVVYVQSSRENPNRINLAQQRKLLQNLKWAAELGAEIYRKQGDDIPEQICKVADQIKATNIVIGKPSFGLVRMVLRKNHLQSLLKKIQGKEIDLIIVF